MNKFKVNWMAKKSEDWIVAALIDESGTEFKEVSINRTNKKGEVFPNFDGIMPGAEIEGNLWTSDAGKHYLFAPKPQKFGGAVGGQQAREKSINKVLDRKEDSIAIAGAQRDAVLIVSSLISEHYYGDLKPDFLKEKIVEWRNWFLSDEFKKSTPPF